MKRPKGLRVTGRKVKKKGQSKQSEPGKQKQIVRVKKSHLKPVSLEVNVPVANENLAVVGSESGAMPISAPPAASSQSSIADLIQKFRNSPPRPREQREPLPKSSFWWLSNQNFQNQENRIQDQYLNEPVPIPASTIPVMASPPTPYTPTNIRTNHVNRMDGMGSEMPSASMDFLTMPWISPRRSVELQNQNQNNHDNHNIAVTENHSYSDRLVNANHLNLNQRRDVRESVEIIADLEDRALELLHKAAFIKTKTSTSNEGDGEGEGDLSHSIDEVDVSFSSSRGGNEYVNENENEYESVLKRAKARLGIGIGIGNEVLVEKVEENEKQVDKSVDGDMNGTLSVSDHGHEQDEASVILERARRRLGLGGALALNESHVHPSSEKEERGDVVAVKEEKEEEEVGSELDISIDVDSQIKQKADPSSPLLHPPTPLNLDNCTSEETGEGEGEMTHSSTPPHSPLILPPSPHSPINHHRPERGNPNSNNEGEGEGEGEAIQRSVSGSSSGWGVKFGANGPHSPSETPPDMRYSFQDMDMNTDIDGDQHVSTTMNDDRDRGNISNDDIVVSPPDHLNLSSSKDPDDSDSDREIVDADTENRRKLDRERERELRKREIPVNRKSRIGKGKNKKPNAIASASASNVNTSQGSGSNATVNMNMNMNQSEADGDGEVRNLVHSVVSAWLFNDTAEIEREIIENPINLNSAVAEVESVGDVGVGVVKEQDGKRSEGESKDAKKEEEAEVEVDYNQEKSIHLLECINEEKDEEEDEDIDFNDIDEDDPIFSTLYARFITLKNALKELEEEEGD